MPLVGAAGSANPLRRCQDRVRRVLGDLRGFTFGDGPFAPLPALLHPLHVWPCPCPFCAADAHWSSGDAEPSTPSPVEAAEVPSVTLSPLMLAPDAGSDVAVAVALRPGTGDGDAAGAVAHVPCRLQALAPHDIVGQLRLHRLLTDLCRELADAVAEADALKAAFDVREACDGLSPAVARRVASVLTAPQPSSTGHDQPLGVPSPLPAPRTGATTPRRQVSFVEANVSTFLAGLSPIAAGGVSAPPAASPAAKTGVQQGPMSAREQAHTEGVLKLLWELASGESQRADGVACLEGPWRRPLKQVLAARTQGSTSTVAAVAAPPHSLLVLSCSHPTAASLHLSYLGLRLTAARTVGTLLCDQLLDSPNSGPFDAAAIRPRLASVVYQTAAAVLSTLRAFRCGATEALARRPPMQRPLLYDEGIARRYQNVRPAGQTFVEDDDSGDTNTTPAPPPPPSAADVRAFLAAQLAAGVDVLPPSSGQPSARLTLQDIAAASLREVTAGMEHVLADAPAHHCGPADTARCASLLGDLLLSFTAAGASSPAMALGAALSPPVAAAGAGGLFHVLRTVLAVGAEARLRGHIPRVQEARRTVVAFLTALFDRCCYAALLADHGHEDAAILFTPFAGASALQLQAFLWRPLVELWLVPLLEDHRDNIEEAVAAADVLSHMLLSLRAEAAAKEDTAERLYAALVAHLFAGVPAGAVDAVGGARSYQRARPLSRVLESVTAMACAAAATESADGGTSPAAMPAHTLLTLLLCVERERAVQLSQMACIMASLAGTDADDAYGPFTAAGGAAAFTLGVSDESWVQYLRSGSAVTDAGHGLAGIPPTLDAYQRALRVIELDVADTIAHLEKTSTAAARNGRRGTKGRDGRGDEEVDDGCEHPKPRIPTHAEVLQKRLAALQEPLAQALCVLFPELVLHHGGAQHPHPTEGEDAGYTLLTAHFVISAGQTTLNRETAKQLSVTLAASGTVEVSDSLLSPKSRYENPLRTPLERCRQALAKRPKIHVAVQCTAAEVTGGASKASRCKPVVAVAWYPPSADRTLLAANQHDLTLIIRDALGEATDDAAAKAKPYRTAVRSSSTGPSSQRSHAPKRATTPKAFSGSHPNPAPFRFGSRQDTAADALRGAHNVTSGPSIAELIEGHRLTEVQPTVRGGWYCYSARAAARRPRGDAATDLLHWQIGLPLPPKQRLTSGSPRRRSTREGRARAQSLQELAEFAELSDEGPDGGGEVEWTVVAAATLLPTAASGAASAASIVLLEEDCAAADVRAARLYSFNPVATASAPFGSSDTLPKARSGRAPSPTALSPLERRASSPRCALRDADAVASFRRATSACGPSATSASFRRQPPSVTNGDVLQWQRSARAGSFSFRSQASFVSEGSDSTDAARVQRAAAERPAPHNIHGAGTDARHAAVLSAMEMVATDVALFGDAAARAGIIAAPLGDRASRGTLHMARSAAGAADQAPCRVVVAFSCHPQSASLWEGLASAGAGRGTVSIRSALFGRRPAPLSSQRPAPVAGAVPPHDALHSPLVDATGDSTLTHHTRGETVPDATAVPVPGVSDALMARQLQSLRAQLAEAEADRDEAREAVATLERARRDWDATCSAHALQIQTLHASVVEPLREEVQRLREEVGGVRHAAETAEARAEALRQRLEAQVAEGSELRGTIAALTERLRAESGAREAAAAELQAYRLVMQATMDAHTPNKNRGHPQQEQRQQGRTSPGPTVRAASPHSDPDDPNDYGPDEAITFDHHDSFASAAIAGGGGGGPQMPKHEAPVGVVEINVDVEEEPSPTPMGGMRPALAQRLARQAKAAGIMASPTRPPIAGPPAQKYVSPPRRPHSGMLRDDHRHSTDVDSDFASPPAARDAYLYSYVDL